jgi:hypothetical protein
MNFDSVKAIIGKVAPWIAATLSGGNPLIGAGTKMLCNALGLKEDAKLEDIQQKLESGTLTSEDFAKIKMAEMQFQKDMQAAGFENEESILRLEVEDRSSARDREKTVRDKTPAILAYIFTVGFFVVVGVVIFRGLPSSESGRDAAMLLIGALAGGVTQNVLGYYFGTSLSSTQKNELLTKK